MRRAILSLVACIIGAASFVDVAVGAYRESRGGDFGSAPLLVLTPMIIAGLLLLVTWWRTAARSPASIPAIIFSGCAFFSYASLPRRFGLEDSTLWRHASWPTFFTGLAIYAIFASLMCAVPVFVFRGTRSFIHLIRDAFSGRHRIV